MLKKFFAEYKKEDSLIRDSFLFFSASMILNLAGFFYHFYMGRVLGPAEYGILGAMLSLLYVILVFFTVVQTSVANVTARLYAKHTVSKVAYLLRNGSLWFAAGGGIGFLFYLFTSFFIPGLTKIPLWTYLSLSLAIPFIFLLPVGRGILQGMQNFKHLSVNLIAEGIGKVVVGILLVAIGWGVTGAVLGIVFSFISAFAIAIISLRCLLRQRADAFALHLSDYFSSSVLASLLILTLMYSIDVLLVRSYFDSVQAGYYASASLMGKIVFFASLAITTVMFPKATALHASGKESKHILNKSLVLVFILIAGALFSTIIFPRFIVLLLFGSEYLAITNILWIFCLAFSLFSLAYLLSMYNLSLNRSSFNYILALFLVVEVIAIALFHKSLEEVVLVLAGVMAALFLSLLIYTFKHNAKTEHSNTGL